MAGSGPFCGGSCVAQGWGPVSGERAGPGGWAGVCWVCLVSRGGTHGGVGDGAVVHCSAWGPEVPP